MRTRAVARGSAYPRGRQAGLEVGGDARASTRKVDGARKLRQDATHRSAVTSDKGRTKLYRQLRIYALAVPKGDSKNDE